MLKVLSDPLPARNWECAPPTPGSTARTWTGRAWREADILPALSGGGWFDPARSYHFDSPATAEFAFASQRLFHSWGVTNAPNA